jgi:glycosyltransferase involved in cell wall biosynthesis
LPEYWHKVTCVKINGNEQIQMKKRKVLLVDIGASFGGVETYVRDLSRMLQDEVEFFVLCVNPQLKRALQEHNLRTFALISARQWPRIGQLMASIVIILFARLYYRIDTVWINGYSEIALMPLARLLGCNAIATRPLTLDVENGRGIKIWKRRAAQLLYRKLACTTDKIVCVTETVASDVAKLVPPHKVVVIPYWIPKLPEPVRHPRPGGVPVRVLFVGRLEMYKGAQLILDAMRQLSALPMSLTVVGDGTYRRTLERQAEGLNVMFVGLQQDPSSYYKEADLFIHPTFGPEGSSLVSLEAMSYGLPCILSDLTVNKELTESGKRALLFRCGDSDDLRSKMQMFVSSPQLSEQYGRLARRMIEDKYSVEVARSRYVKELQSWRA